MNHLLHINSYCLFTFNHNAIWLLEPHGQNKIRYENREFFVWSDPEYGGDNTIKPYKGNPYEDFRGARAKGWHNIEAYCGKDVIFQLEEEAVK